MYVLKLIYLGSLLTGNNIGRISLSAMEQTMSFKRHMLVLVYRAFLKLEVTR